MEAFTRFFVGAYRVDLTYDDDMASICQQNLISPTGFWFDCVTSIPWSFMDLRVYLVSPALLRLCCTSVAPLVRICCTFCTTIAYHLLNH